MTAARPLAALAAVVGGVGLASLHRAADRLERAANDAATIARRNAETETDYLRTLTRVVDAITGHDYPDDYDDDYDDETGAPTMTDIAAIMPITGPADLLPTRAHADDAGLDLRAAADAVIPSGHRALIPTGVSVALPSGHVGMVCPRSGLAARHGVTVLNAPGIVDAGYRGDVGVVLVNHGRESYRVTRGDRIAQLVVMPVATLTLVHVDELPDADDGRESGGFGSTGA